MSGVSSGKRAAGRAVVIADQVEAGLVDSVAAADPAAVRAVPAAHVHPVHRVDRLPNNTNEKQLQSH